MTIGRREVVGWGALGFGAVVVDGCGGFFPKTPPPPNPSEVDALLAALDQVVVRLAALEPDVRRFGMKARAPYVAEGQELCKRLLTALCCMGTYRDVPPAMWADARIEQRLAETFPKIYATIRSALHHLSNIDDDEGARVDERLKDDPNLPMRIIERVDDLAKQIDVPLEQRAYLRTATTQLAWRMKIEGTSEVTTGVAKKFRRASAMRLAALGMEGELETEKAEEEKTHPVPIRSQFRTRASKNSVEVATCALQPTVMIDGADRQIMLDWDEFRCVRTKASDEQPFHATVHLEAGEDGENLVTIVLYPLEGTGDEEALSRAVTSISSALRRRLDQELVGQPCVVTADCGTLHCIDSRCRDPRAQPASPLAEVRLGETGESCRTSADCENPLLCANDVCGTDLPKSERLIRTTKEVAKWGAYLSIPPICAIGALVLLSCLFMVIVAGCLYAGGD